MIRSLAKKISLYVVFFLFLTALISGVFTFLLSSRDQWINKGAPFYTILQWLSHALIGNLSYFAIPCLLITFHFFWRNLRQSGLLKTYLFCGGNHVMLRRRFITGTSLLISVFVILHFTLHAKYRKMADIIMEDDIMKYFALPHENNLMSQRPIALDNYRFFFFSYSEPGYENENIVKINNPIIVNSAPKDDFSLTHGKIAFLQDSVLKIIDSENIRLADNTAHVTAVEELEITAPQFREISQAIEKLQDLRIESMNLRDIYQALKINAKFYYSGFQIYSYLLIVFISMVIFPAAYFFGFVLRDSREKW